MLSIVIVLCMTAFLQDSEGENLVSSISNTYEKTLCNNHPFMRHNRQCSGNNVLNLQTNFQQLLKKFQYPRHLQYDKPILNPQLDQISLNSNPHVWSSGWIQIPWLYSDLRFMANVQFPGSIFTANYNVKNEYIPTTSPDTQTSLDTSEIAATNLQESLLNRSYDVMYGIGETTISESFTVTDKEIYTVQTPNPKSENEEEVIDDEETIHSVENNSELYVTENVISDAHNYSLELSELLLIKNITNVHTSEDILKQKDIKSDNTSVKDVGLEDSSNLNASLNNFYISVNKTINRETTDRTLNNDNVQETVLPNLKITTDPLEGTSQDNYEVSEQNVQMKTSNHFIKPINTQHYTLLKEDIPITTETIEFSGHLDVTDDNVNDRQQSTIRIFHGIVQDSTTNDNLFPTDVPKMYQGITESSPVIASSVIYTKNYFENVFSLNPNFERKQTTENANTIESVNAKDSSTEKYIMKRTNHHDSSHATQPVENSFYTDILPNKNIEVYVNLEQLTTVDQIDEHDENCTFKPCRTSHASTKLTKTDIGQNNPDIYMSTTNYDVTDYIKLNSNNYFSLNTRIEVEMTTNGKLQSIKNVDETESTDARFVINSTPKIVTEYIFNNAVTDDLIFSKDSTLNVLKEPVEVVTNNNILYNTESLILDATGKTDFPLPEDETKLFNYYKVSPALNTEREIDQHQHESVDDQSFVAYDKLTVPDDQDTSSNAYTKDLYKTATIPDDQFISDNDYIKDLYKTSTALDDHDTLSNAYFKDLYKTTTNSNWQFELTPYQKYFVNVNGDIEIISLDEVTTLNSIKKYKATNEKDNKFEESEESGSHSVNTGLNLKTSQEVTPESLVSNPISEVKTTVYHEYRSDINTLETLTQNPGNNFYENMYHTSPRPSVFKYIENLTNDETPINESNDWRFVTKEYSRLKFKGNKNKKKIIKNLDKNTLPRFQSFNAIMTTTTSFGEKEGTTDVSFTFEEPLTFKELKENVQHANKTLESAQTESSINTKNNYETLTLSYEENELPREDSLEDLDKSTLKFDLFQPATVIVRNDLIESTKATNLLHTYFEKENELLSEMESYLIDNDSLKTGIRKHLLPVKDKQDTYLDDVFTNPADVNDYVNVLHEEREDKDSIYVYKEELDVNEDENHTIHNNLKNDSSNSTVEDLLRNYYKFVSNLDVNKSSTPEDKPKKYQISDSLSQIHLKLNKTKDISYKCSNSSSCNGTFEKDRQLSSTESINNKSDVSNKTTEAIIQINQNSTTDFVHSPVHEELNLLMKSINEQNYQNIDSSKKVDNVVSQIKNLLNKKVVTHTEENDREKRSTPNDQQTFHTIEDEPKTLSKSEAAAAMMELLKQNANDFTEDNDDVEYSEYDYYNYDNSYDNDSGGKMVGLKVEEKREESDDDDNDDYYYDDDSSILELISTNVTIGEV